MSYFDPHAEAQMNGYAHGQIVGRQHGIEEGKREGYQLGYNQGREDGYNAGWNEAVRLSTINMTKQQEITGRHVADKRLYAIEILKLEDIVKQLQAQNQRLSSMVLGLAL